MTGPGERKVSRRKMSMNTRIDTTVIRGAGLDLTWQPDDKECDQIAERLGVEAVGRFDAELTLSPARGGAIIAEGRVRAKVTQLCVVSLEPIETEVDARIDDVFRPLSGGDVVIDVESPDDAEPFDGTTVDAVSLVIDTVAMELDPYPRAENAVLDLSETSGSVTVDAGPLGEPAPADAPGHGTTQE